MTTRKPRAALTPPPPMPKAVPYPPEAIWRTWEDGAQLTYRGNTFMRRGDRVARVFENATSADSKPPVG